MSNNASGVHATILRNNILGYVDRIRDRNRRRLRAGIITLANSKSAKQSPILQALNGMVITHPSSLKKKASVQEGMSAKHCNLSSGVVIRRGI
jgi:hypothetical protein